MAERDLGRRYFVAVYPGIGDLGLTIRTGAQLTSEFVRHGAMKAVAQYTLYRGALVRADFRWTDSYTQPGNYTCRVWVLNGLLWQQLGILTAQLGRSD